MIGSCDAANAKTRVRSIVVLATVALHDGVACYYGSAFFCPLTIVLDSVLGYKVQYHELFFFQTVVSLPIHTDNASTCKVLPFHSLFFVLIAAVRGLLQLPCEIGVVSKYNKEGAKWQ